MSLSGLNPEKLIQNITIKAPAKQVVQVLRIMNRLDSQLAAGVKGRMKTELRRRLDLTVEEVERFIRQPSLYTGVVDRCKVWTQPGWIQSYLEYTKDHEAPEEFHFWVAVTIIAGAIGRDVSFHKGYYKVYTNHYVILVAPPGRCRKSVSIDIGVKFLRKLNDGQNHLVNIIAEKITPEALAETMRFTRIVNGAVSTNCNGFISAPELNVFLGKQKYNVGLIDLLTRLYDCPAEWEFKTRTQTLVSLKDVSLTFIGGTTPEALINGMSQDAFGGGFMSRPLFIVKPDSPRIFAMSDPPPPELAKMLQAQLLEIATTKGAFTLDGASLKWYQEWYEATRLRAPTLDPRMSYYMERKPDHMIRLAMVMAIAEQKPLVLTEELMGRCLKLLGLVEAAMPDAFAELEASSTGKENVRVLNSIKKKGGQITHAALAHLLFRYFDRQQLYRACGMLQEAGLITIEKIDGKAHYVVTEMGEEFI